MLELFFVYDSNCTTKNNGSRQQNKVEELIAMSTIYKGNIEDANALKSLPLLLTDEARIWWQGAKSSVNTWNSAMQLLRKSFAPDKPNFRIYTQIFESHQKNNESTDLFLFGKRALFEQMKTNKPASAAMQLDMFYGLLKLSIKQRINRNDIQSFDDLVEKAQQQINQTSQHNKYNKNYAFFVNPEVIQLKNVAEEIILKDRKHHQQRSKLILKRYLYNVLAAAYMVMFETIVRTASEKQMIQQFETWTDKGQENLDFRPLSLLSYPARNFQGFFYVGFQHL